MAAGGEGQALGLIRMFDVSGDGAWSRAEMDAWQASLESGFLSNERLVWLAVRAGHAMFRHADADKSGLISPKELAVGLLLQPPPAQFAIADANGDGGLDLAEFLAVRRQIPAVPK